MWFFVGMTLLFVHAYTVPLTLPALLIGSILSHLDFLDEQIEQLSDAIAEQIVVRLSASSPSSNASCTPSP